jgi:FkbM family methyltransferase
MSESPTPTAAARLFLRLARLYPMYRGRGRLALSPFLRAKTVHDGMPLLQTLASGEHVYVFANDYIGRMVTFFGDLDPAISDLIRKIVRRGDVVVDVGANVGIVTLQSASLVGSRGKVFAFEPVARLADLLERSSAENGFGNVTVLRVALSDFAGKGVMHVPDQSLGCSTLRPGLDGESCQVNLLDAVDFGPDFKNPRLLKIDVEGHEAEVLAGGRSFLARHRPEYVLFESHADRGPFWQRPEVLILRESGYRFRAVVRTTFARPTLREIDPKGAADPRHYDYLAASDRRSFDI